MIYSFRQELKWEQNLIFIFKNYFSYWLIFFKKKSCKVIVHSDKLKGTSLEHSTY